MIQKSKQLVSGPVKDGLHLVFGQTCNNIRVVRRDQTEKHFAYFHQLDGYHEPEIFELSKISNKFEFVEVFRRIRQISTSKPEVF